MQKWATLTVVMGLAVLSAGEASAQGRAGDPPAGAPGVITKGSGDTSIGGQPAARAGDTTDSAGTLEQGSSNVFINGRPAVTAGDKTKCGGVTIGGASNVFINGKPVARAGDMTTGCK